MQFHRGGAVLQFVVFHQGIERQLAFLADQYQRGVQLIGQGGADDKTTGIYGGNGINIVAVVAVNEGINQLAERGAVLEHGGDVAEGDAWLGPVWHGANGFLDAF